MVHLAKGLDVTKKVSEQTPTERKRIKAWRKEYNARVKLERAVPQPTIPTRHHVRGVSTLVDENGNAKLQWIKTAQDHETRAEFIARTVAELPKVIQPRLGHVRRPEHCRDDLMSVYPLGDPHMGLLAWKDESGEDYDLDEGSKLLTGGMQDLVMRGPRTKRALIAELGDFFHADGHGTTTKGTHVDVDIRTAKVWQVGIAAMTSLIDAALAHHELVEVDCRIGNHDGFSAIALAGCLAQHYLQEPRVRIPMPTSHRAYYTFGKNLIGITHGDRAKPEALGEIMAAERPEDWGRTKHRVWYVGHVHHSSVKDFRGCSVETFRTLAARDGWHAGEGYVAARDMQRIVLHREHGVCERQVVNVQALRSGWSA